MNGRLTGKRIGKALRKFWWLLLLYAGFWVLLICFTTFEEYWKPRLDGIFGADFYVNYLSSLVQDLIFFGLIGMASLVITTKLPEDENFETRIRSLANAQQVSSVAKSYLVESVTKFLTYNSTASVHFILKEYIPKTQLVSVHTTMRHRIMNMCEDVATNKIDAPGRVWTVEKHNDRYGHISMLSAKHSGANGSEEVIIGKNNNIKDLKQSDTTFDLNFQIARDGFVDWTLSFMIYIKVGGPSESDDNWLFAKASRFTEKTEVTIASEIDGAAQFTFKYVDRKTPQDAVVTKELSLEAHTEKELARGLQFLSGDSVQLYFTKVQPTKP